MVNYSKPLFAVFLLTVLFTSASIGQDVSTADPEQRIKQLEAQVQKMQAELDQLKQLIVKTAPAAEPNAPAVAARPDAATAKSEPTEKSAAIQQPAKPTRGIDVGSAKIIPYGTIYFNAFGNSAGVNNSDIPMFATPSGSEHVSASARQTRLGLRLEGAKVGNARLSATVEADFFGGFPSVAVGENFGIVRLRLANAKLDWERTSLTVGQDWMVFAPVNPVSPAAAAIPLMAASGNNWARLPQVKIEHKFGDHVTWQAAVLAPQTGDFPTSGSFSLQPTSGASSRVPFLQSRIAYGSGNWLGVKKSGGIGLSGHYGRSKVITGANVENEIESIGVALDWNFPLAARVTFAGEAFFGRNLGGFQSGVFQSYNTDFAYMTGSNIVPGGVRAIGTRGGWAQLGFTPPVLGDKLSLYGAVGVDDPRNRDLSSRTPRDWRTQNFSYAFDAVYKFTPQFSIGAEYRRLRTIYLLSGRRNADHVNLGAAYSF